MPHYDAVLFVSFGGPEKRDDVIPFLENVLRGRNVPRERMLAVAEHYYHFDGVSPINQQNRDLIAAVEKLLRQQGLDIPIYFGNRNWHPMLTDTVQQMAEDGIQNALAFVTSAYSSYSGCRQYRENIIESRNAVGAQAPVIDKIRAFYNHPDYIAANVDRAGSAISQLTADQQKNLRLLFTAHSIPTSMSSTSDYVKQLEESCQLVADRLQLNSEQWKLVYQSRSGRPQDPWLEPDVLDDIQEHASDCSAVVIVPIGFLSDHMEVMYDLDIEAKDLCEKLGLPMVRAETVGTHPLFVSMVVKLIKERLFGDHCRESMGQFGPNWDHCQENCCPAPASAFRKRPDPSNV